MTAVLALDLATSTGWARRDRAGNITSGTQRFKRADGESLGAQLLRFRRWLREQLGGEFAPTRGIDDRGGVVAYDGGLIAYERPLTVARGFKAGIGKELEALILVEAAEAGIEARSVAPGTLKKHATGHGTASKHDMLRAAVKRWGPELEAQKGPAGPLPGDDEADALCVLAWALEGIGEAVNA